MYSNKKNIKMQKNLHSKNNNIVKQKNLHYNINGEWLMKKNIIGKIIVIIMIIAATVEVGIAVGWFMLANIDSNKYNVDYNIEVVR